MYVVKIACRLGKAIHGHEPHDDDEPDDGNDARASPTCELKLVSRMNQLCSAFPEAVDS